MGMFAKIVIGFLLGANSTYSDVCRGICEVNFDDCPESIRCDAQTCNGIFMNFFGEFDLRVGNVVSCAYANFVFNIYMAEMYSEIQTERVYRPFQ